MASKRIGSLTFFFCSLIIINFSNQAVANKTVKADKATKTRIQKSYGRLPLSFIQNDGQVDKRVKFYERGSGHTTFFTKDGVYLQLIKGQEPEVNHRSSVVDLRSETKKNNNPTEYKSQLIKLLPLGANENPEIIAEGMQKSKVNYFIGNDQKKWRRNIPTYRAVMYKKIYPGINMKFYGNNRQLEYDIIVKPGVNPSVVRLSYEGIDGLEVTEGGDLEIVLKEGSLIQKKPYVYQEINGKKVELSGKFKILNSQSTISNQQYVYGFEVASYNKKYPLIIDPILVYSTYLGGSSLDDGEDISVDTDGNAYVTGETMSTDFPIVSPYQNNHAGGTSDVFVTKIDSSGSNVTYSTYLGGSNEDYCRGIVVSKCGNVYITGNTRSTDFPIVSPYQNSHAGGMWDVFITKLDSSGSSITYSTYLGGSSDDLSFGGIALDDNENIYVTGNTNSIDFPIVFPIQESFAGGDSDAFVTKINATGSTLSYSTYLGGSDKDHGRAIDVDTSERAHITGNTWSDDFPVAAPMQGNFAGIVDAFVAEIDANGLNFVYSTYLGGSDLDCSYDITVDADGNAYVTGGTYSIDFPTVSPIQGENAGMWDAFVTMISSSNLNFNYSTYLGGSGNDWSNGIVLDCSKNIYITGTTSSGDFPVISPIQGIYAGGVSDAFVMKIASSGSILSYSTYLGGSGEENGRSIAVDTSMDIYIIGRTSSNDFPTVSPFQAFNAGEYDAFVAKIEDCIDNDNDGFFAELGCGSEVDCDDVNGHEKMYRKWSRKMYN